MYGIVWTVHNFTLVCLTETHIEGMRVELLSDTILNFKGK